MPIHPTAIVAQGAEIDSTADIGPYCTIGPRVKVGAKSRLISHVVVDNDTTIGAGNVIHPFASVGSAPQDLKFKGEPSRLVIGDNNIIREGATLNIGTEGGGMETRVGSHCLLMNYAHVAHDCRIGDHVIMVNYSGLAGHVELHDHVIVGGFGGVHQFCRIGRHAFLTGGAKVAQDVPPFCTAHGEPGQLVGINVVGLKRAGWTRDDIGMVRKAFKKLFQSGPTRMVALERTEDELAQSSPLVKEMTDFIRDAQRGVCSARQTFGAADDADDN